jgi:hypothetical protein
VARIVLRNVEMNSTIEQWIDELIVVVGDAQASGEQCLTGELDARNLGAESRTAYSSSSAA